MHLPILVVAVFLTATASVAAEPRPLTPVDMVELTRLSEPALSPDGSKLIYLRSEVDWTINKEIKRYRLVDLETGDAQPLFDPESEKESFGAAHWAPDSSGFVTILKREADEHDQVYLFSLETGELIRLTAHNEDVEDIIWAPDGGAFYFRARKPDAEPRAALLDGKWLIQAYDERRRREIWRFDIASGTAERVVGGNYYVRAYSLSRDGSKIIYLRAAGGLRDDRHEGDLWLHDLATGAEARLTENAYYEARARLSPDNRHFAYIATVNAKGDPYYEDNLFVQAVGETEPRLLLPDEPMEVLDFAWTATGDGLFILGNVGLRSELFLYSLADDSLTQITDGEHAVRGWSYLPGTDTHVALITTSSSPGDVHVMRADEAGFRPATDEYADWPGRFRLPRQEAFRWRARDRTPIEGLLVYPLDHEDGRPFPLVTITHGGPRSSAQFGSWNVSRYVPVLAGQGYGVLLPNHRGGTGYGDAFMRDMVGGYFRNAHRDVLDGIDALIDRGLADPERLIKMGWSAGGHMTNKLITVTAQFKAASSGAGAAEWMSMYGESDTRYNRTPWFGGTPWQRRAPLKRYAKHSPLKDAWRVTTPTLFFVGGSDIRVPPTQSILMYRGVKDAGAETELYVAPDQPHGYRRPSYRLFKINTELAWYAHHVLGETFEPVLPAAAGGASEKDKATAEQAPEPLVCFAPLGKDRREHTTDCE